MVGLSEAQDNKSAKLDPCSAQLWRASVRDGTGNRRREHRESRFQQVLSCGWSVVTFKDVK